MKSYIIVIYGKSSAGKDTLMEAVLQERDFFHKVLRTTTRPQRLGEANDNYEFIIPTSNEITLHKEDTFIEHQMFRGWFYGTRKSNICDDINIMTGSIDIVEDLQRDYSDDFYIFPVYLDLDDKSRMYRALQREHKPDMHEICRRFVSEIEQYERLHTLDNIGLQLDARKSTEELTKELIKEFDRYYMERLGVY